jgi:hypothetical protein
MQKQRAMNVVGVLNPKTTGIESSNPYNNRRFKKYNHKDKERAQHTSTSPRIEVCKSGSIANGSAIPATNHNNHSTNIRNRTTTSIKDYEHDRVWNRLGVHCRWQTMQQKVILAPKTNKAMESKSKHKVSERERERARAGEVHLIDVRRWTTIVDQTKRNQTTSFAGESAEREHGRGRQTLPAQQSRRAAPAARHRPHAPRIVARRLESGRPPPSLSLRALD